MMRTADKDQERQEVWDCSNWEVDLDTLYSKTQDIDAKTTQKHEGQ